MYSNCKNIDTKFNKQNHVNVYYQNPTKESPLVSLTFLCVGPLLSLPNHEIL